MGYRSQVAIAVTNKVAKEFLKTVYDIGLQDSVTVEATYTVIRFDSVKWYEEYEHIQKMELFLKTLAPEEYGFIRIGEEFDDVEIKGSPSNFNMGVDRKIELY